jgi:hypothetical protein
MRAISKFLALALAAVLQPAVAAPAVVSIDFEDVNSFVDPDFGVGLVGDHYAKLGVTFSGAAWGARAENNTCPSGFGINFVNGSCGALFLAQDANGTIQTTPSTLYINVAAGFETEFDFVFALAGASNASIAVYDGLDGTGNKFKLSQDDAVFSNAGCNSSNARFCDFTGKAVAFSGGVAHSIAISGVDQSLMLDNLKFTLAAPTNRTPEPASAALALGALGALAWTRKRKAR